MPRKSTLYLPPEVVEIIAGYLAFEHPPTLLRFAKASRTYYASCQPAIKSIKFHDIKLQVSASKEQFQIVVNHLIEQLKGKDGLPYVRQLIIIGQRVNDEPYEWKTPQMSELRCNGPRDTYTTQYGEWIERFGRERDASYLNPVYRMNPEHCAYESMVKLIKLLPGLTDLIWNQRARVPPSVVEALRQVRPRCRLHLDGLFHICDINPEKDLDDLAFITSPSIHSFKVNCRDACDRSLFHFPGFAPHPTCYDSVLRFARLAPNLKNIRIKECPSLDGPALGPNGFQSGILSLEALTFEKSWWFDERRLCEWSYYMNFSTLQTLVIHGRLKDEAFKVWDKMGFLFSSLKTLYLNLAGSHPLEFYDDANEFLQRLPPLTELGLKGWHSRMGIESLLGVHGSHLRKLRLIKPEAWQTLSGHQIRQISQKCSLLADLEVKVDGTQSHANKHEIYAALGSIRNLKYLDLTYEVHFVGLPTIPREEIVRRRDIPEYQELPSYSSFGEFENQVCEEASEWLPNHRLRNGHLQKIIVDSVMDERLACEVFQVISDTKTQSLSLFKDLTIKIRGADIDEKRLRYLVDTFSSDWHVIRDTDFRHRGKLIAKEIEPDSDRIGGRYVHLPLWMEPIFYELFPAAKPKGQQRKVSKKLSAKRDKEKNQSIPTWRRYLHSFPATSATDN